MLAALATVFGVFTVVASLLQARRMLVLRDSSDVSLAWLLIRWLNYIIWLSYGTSIGNIPLIVTHSLGTLTGALILAVALYLRKGKS